MSVKVPATPPFFLLSISLPNLLLNCLYGQPSAAESQHARD